MILLWTSLRSLVYLKRISLAMERIAVSIELRGRPTERKRAKVGRVFTPTTEELNAVWRAEQAGEPEIDFEEEDV
jgi:hypothetical protein